jgi:RNA recognition motif. (a.k.a. RRM, RBD, or RNP domain)
MIEYVFCAIRNGRTKGYAFVYLKNASNLDKAIDFIDGRHIRSRQVRAKKQLGNESTTAAAAEAAPAK